MLTVPVVELVEWMLQLTAVGAVDVVLSRMAALMLPQHSETG